VCKLHKKSQTKKGEEKDTEEKKGYHEGIWGLENTDVCILHKNMMWFFLKTAAGLYI